jgi:hypothetical protein
MDSIAKFLVVLIATVLFSYFANLAFQGNLEMRVILRDSHTLSEYLKEHYANIKERIL